MRELLVSAGSRPQMPAEDLALLRAAARAEWQRVVDERRSSRWRSLRPLLVVAGSILVAGWVLWRFAAPVAPVAPAAPVAVVAALEGGGARADSSPLAPGTVVRAGATLTTGVGQGAGVVGLAWRDGRSVRLAEDSRLRVVSPARVELERGAIYVDTPGTVAPGAPFVVATRLGAVVERGTQFEVRLEAEGSPLRVRVREGRVEVQTAEAGHQVAAGEQWTLGSQGRGEREPIAAWDDSWSWVLRAVETPSIEGRDLASFLAWACRETGRELAWASPGLAEEARAIELHGSVQGLTPDEAVAVVLAGSRLEARRDAGRLLVAPVGDR